MKREYATLAAVGGRALGAVSNTQMRRYGMHALALGLVAGGGGLTGWLSAGTRRGAIIGASVHLGLFGMTGMLFGSGQLSTAERMAYGAVGLGGIATAAYLYYGRRRQ